MKIIECRPHVSIKSKDSSTDGILALIDLNNTISLIWSIHSNLSQNQLKAFKSLSNLIDCNLDLQISLNNILSITIIPQLSILNKKACCITSIEITNTSNNTWSTLYFDPVNNTIQSPNDVISMLRSWLAPFKRNLINIDENQNTFYLTEKQDRKWPDGLPQPSDSSPVSKISHFGIDMVSNLFGAPLANSLENAGWDVLEGFAKVTLFAKDKTTQALKHPLTQPLLPLIPENIRSHFLTSAEAEALLLDYDSAQRYLAQFATDLQSRLVQKPLQKKINDTTFDFENIRKHYVSHFTGNLLSREKWDAWKNPDGSLSVPPYYVACTIFCGGIEPSLRAEVWPFILGHDDWRATKQQQIELRKLKSENYIQMRQSWMQILKDIVLDANSQILQTAGDETESADAVTKLAERKYRIDKDVVRTDQTIDFYKLGKEIDSNIPLADNIDSQPHLVMLRNVLMTYTILNFELGYVQGMNDLASPLLETIQDEVTSFWSFTGFMEKMKGNFNRDQSGMRKQLRQVELLLKALDPPLHEHFEMTDSVNMFACFRSLLILFKRELHFQDIKTLWEIIWTCPLTSNFHLFVMVAILNLNRQALFECQAFDEVLKFINELSQHINVPEIIQHAEILFYILRDLMMQQSPQELNKQHLNGSFGVETTLNDISGIFIQPMILETMTPTEVELKEEEWMELMTVFETDCVFVQGNFMNLV